MKFIELETAKLAKEKGFPLTIIKPNGEYIIYSAPYQVELQDWLRDKHNIHIYVNHYEFSVKSGNGYYFHIGKSIMNSNTKYTGKYESYEDALEDGLYEALKLIK